MTIQRIVQSFENLPKNNIDQALADIVHGLYCRRFLSQHNLGDQAEAVPSEQ
jgi:Tfp pilus assembly pilus retraction ATPase PilT